MSDDLEVLAGLHDPVRRSLYDLVAASGGEVGRGEAAESAGISRTLAAFHLDKLVDAGLLESGFRAQAKKGPGSGRPAKVYRRAKTERSFSLPPRDYTTLAVILADVVDLLGGDEQAENAARAAGERLGRRIGAQHTQEATPEDDPGADGEGGPERGRVNPSTAAGGDVVEVLRERGYEPFADGEQVRLRNCPFHVLAEQQPLLVCSMNLALCQGILRGLGDDPGRARLDPRPGECCVALSKTNES